MTRHNTSNSQQQHSEPFVTLVPTPEPQRLPLNFVLSDCPTPGRLAAYVAAYRQRGVRRCLVRICDPGSYDRAEFEALSQSEASAAAGGSTATATTGGGTEGVIRVHDHIKFEDGGVPSAELVSAWLDLVDAHLQQQDNDGGEDGHSTVVAVHGGNKQPPSVVSQDTATLPAIALHCVSGLGRAPVLVAVAILEYCAHMESLDVVEYLRRYRRGVLNSTQLHWLEEVYWKKLRRQGWKQRRKLHHHQHKTDHEAATGTTAKKGLLARVKSIFKR